MKNIYLLLITLISVVTANAQRSDNYSFATSSTASLTDMSTGTTQLIGASQDDSASQVTNTGFEFWFLGTRYTQFSANSNGFIRLGGGVISRFEKALGNPSLSVNLITALGADLQTSTNGKVHYKVTGSLPNRVLVIEFKNMAIVSPGSTADGTYQVRLYETSNRIEFVYGSMNRNNTAGVAQFIGFSSNNFNYATYVTGTATLTTSGGITSQQYTLNTPITDLTSIADGTRKMFTFSTNAIPAPTGLTFTAVTAVGMTLNWIDNTSDEAGFAIYRSDDGGLTYNFISQTTDNTTSYVQSGLIASTNYFWKVYAVREGPSSALTGNRVTNAPGNITSNGTGGGYWSEASTWAGGVLPTTSDNVIIKNSDVVLINNSTAVAYNLFVGEGTSGVLIFHSQPDKITVGSNVTINPGGIFKTEDLGIATTHELSIAGNLVNNGTLDFSTNNNTAGANITFTGATNNSFTGNGAITDVYAITINKGFSWSNILELMPVNFTVRGVSSSATAFLALINGTLKISGSFTMSNPVSTIEGFLIQPTAGIWLNNANFTLTNTTILVRGLFRITQGLVTISDFFEKSIFFSTGSTIIVEGGNVQTAACFAALSQESNFSYTQSGGTITVRTGEFFKTSMASFDLGSNTSSLINISGGTVICQYPAFEGIDYHNQAGTGRAGVTGGTLQIGNSNTFIDGLDFKISGVIPNLVLGNIAGSNDATIIAVPGNYENSSLNINIATGKTLEIVDVPFKFYGTALTNNGALFVSQPNAGFYASNNTAPQLYSGSGNFGTTASPLNALIFESTAGFTIAPASPNIVTSAVALMKGNVINSNKLTVGNGGSSTAFVIIGDGTTATPAGMFDQPLTYNPGTGGINLVYQHTTTSRSTGPEIPLTRSITHLSYYDTDPTHSLTIAGGDLTVSGTILMASGNINTGANTLVLGNSTAVPGSLSYTSGTIVGKFKRWISPVTGNRVFPVGTNSVKRNASINFTAFPLPPLPPATGGTLTAEWISSPAGTNGLPLVNSGISITNTSSAGYWRLTAGDGLNGGTYTGTFTATGIPGVVNVEELVLLKRTNPGSPWTLNGGHVTSSGTIAAPIISRTGMSGFSDFGIGSSNLNALPVQLTLFNVKCDGNNVVINWKTAQEQNSSHFIVEGSRDGINWTGIGNIPAAGNSNTERSYSFKDNNTLQSSYYRIAQYDMDGQVELTRILRSSCEAIVVFKIWPNPFSETVFVNISAYNGSQAVIKVFDNKGALVKTQRTLLLQGSNQINVDMKNLVRGNYQLAIEWENGQKKRTVQVIKQ